MQSVECPNPDRLRSTHAGLNHLLKPRFDQQLRRDEFHFASCDVRIQSTAEYHRTVSSDRPFSLASSESQT